MSEAPVDSLVEPHGARAMPQWVWLGAIVLLTATVYALSLGNGLTNWDDDAYVTGNPLFGRPLGETMQLAFTTYWKGNYHPLTMLSLALDHTSSGGSVRAHHIVSLALHLANTALVAIWLRSLLGSAILAGLCAAFFGLHPMHVESVAWISARKDLVSALFFLLSMLAYTSSIRSDARRRGAAYALSLVFFGLALLSKGTAVALAPSLLAVDVLRGRSLLSARVLLEKLPFFALALIFGLIALDAQAGVGQLHGVSNWTGPERIALAATAYLRYIALLVLPLRLSAFYPYPEAGDTGLPALYYAALPCVLAIAALWWVSLKRWPVVAFGLAFYTLNILFVLQLVPVGGAIIADRYSYLSSIGLFVVWAWAGRELVRRWPSARVPASIALAVWLVVSCALTVERSLVWRDSLSLWNDTLATYPDIPEARLNRALARYGEGDWTGAVADLGDAVRLSPDYAQAWGHRGVIRHQLGENAEALEDLDRAVRLEPSPDLLSNRGAVRLAIGDARGAIVDMSRALEMDPNRVLAWTNRGLARSEIGQHAAALRDFEVALQLAPGYAPAIYGRAVALRETGEGRRALADLDALVGAAPQDAQVRLTRGETLLDLGRQREACAELHVAADLGAGQATTLILERCDD